MAVWEQLKKALNDPASSAPGDVVYGRNWDQWCQALVFQMCRLFGHAGHVYGTATEARLASGNLNPDRHAAPAGAIHYWTQNHVGIGLGGEVVLMASKAVQDRWTPNGTVGVTTVTTYTGVKGLGYAGWSLMNGVNSIPIADVYSFGSATAGLGGTSIVTATQRKVLSTGVANRRNAPSTAAGTLVDPPLPVNTVGNFNGWIHGEMRPGGNDVWFRGISGNWFWSGGFTDTGTHDLADLNPVVVPPVVVPPVTPPVTPPVAPPVTPPVVVPNPTPPYSIRAHGIDVGTGQSSIDFNAVVAAGISFAIVKMGGLNVLPQYVAPHYAAEVDAARASGLKIGHYYLIGAGQTPTEQANFFVDNLHNFDVNADVLALDNEPLDSNKAQWGDAQAAEFFAQVVIRTGTDRARLWHYSSANQFRALAPWPLTTSLGVKVWWASYGANPAGATPDHVPDLRGSVPDWWVHQYSSVTPLGGVAKVDISASRETAETLFAKGTVIPPVITPPVITPPVTVAPLVMPPAWFIDYVLEQREAVDRWLADWDKPTA